MTNFKQIDVFFLESIYLYLLFSSSTAKFDCCNLHLIRFFFHTFIHLKQVS